MFKNSAAEFVYYRTYSRWQDNLGRRETWEETVDRVINFFQEERGNLIPSKVLRKIKEGMLNFDVMPSMRLVWAAGEAAKKDNTTLYNCSFITVDNIKAFSECLYILCCGTGVGFSVENKYIEKLPEVKQFDLTATPDFIVIADDKQGWADSIHSLISTLYEGKDIQFDYSLIRPKGARLKTMGGRASGPEPLILVHGFIRDIFNKAQGRKLSALECHDIMNKIAEIVVVGGVRRSSQISLSDLNDEQMRHAKDWPFPLHRAMANNSAVYLQKPTAVEFLKEWSALAASGTGERGISNLGAARIASPKRRNGDLIQGFNPSLRMGTKILTETGIVPIESLQDKVFYTKTINGDWTKAKCWLSGKDKELYKITLSTGFEYYCTAEHKWPVMQNNSISKKPTTELIVGDKFPTLRQKYLFEAGILGTQEDGFILGWLYGDGWICKRSDNNKMQYGFIVSKKDQEDNIDKKIENYLYKITGNEFKGCDNKNQGNIEYNSSNKKLFEHFTKFKVCSKEEGVPESLWYGSEELRKGFIDGIFSSDGTVDLQSNRIRLSSSKKKLIEDISELLGFYGVISTIMYSQHTGSFPNKKDYGKLYDRYTLSINGYENIEHFRNIFNLSLKYKQENINKLITTRVKGQDKQYVTIKHIEKTAIKENVWDVSVEHESHCFQLSHCITGNCHEIALRNLEFCNLSSIIVRPEDDLDSLLEKVETATWIGTIQSSFTNFPYLREDWKKNCEEEALLGVSISGQMDNTTLLTEEVFKALKSRAIKVNKKAAKQLNINEATAITCVKPEGTSSQVVYSGSGLHPWYSPYFIRRYRISANDPLYKMLKDQGLDMKPENGQIEETANTWVISFPMKAPDNAITKDMLTAIDQLEWYKKVQISWCEHNASMTCYVKDHEWFEVGNWIYQNWDIVNGLSFLPADGGKYQQAPLEEITKEQYDKMIKIFPKIDYNLLSLYEVEDNTEGAKTLACTGGACEL